MDSPPFVFPQRTPAKRTLAVLCRTSRMKMPEVITPALRFSTNTRSKEPHS